jgi:hypothetical protein
LVLRVAREPVEPRRLTPQQHREIHDRIKMGEPKDRIAHAYNVDVDTIGQLVR